MAKTVKVNQDLCISCSTCWVLNPTNFAQGADGKAKVKKGSNDDALATEALIEEDGGVEDAKNSCPVGAISVSEEE